jgi:histidyl-tRNA synthetase
MMNRVSSVRGFPVILGTAAESLLHVERAMERSIAKFGFEHARLPILEHVEVFERSVQELVHANKELFEFETRSGYRVALRPEGTAGIARAIADVASSGNFPKRIWYSGPMFRYERPQKGRFRQFHQFGAEMFGEIHPLSDVEIIDVAKIGLEEVLGKDLFTNCTLLINSVGTKEDREVYSELLSNWLNQHKDQLSPESIKRLEERRVLRILDSKSPQDQSLFLQPDFPKLMDSLSEESNKRFEQVLKGLSSIGIPYQLDPFLVRGLDYYSHTAFEFVVSEKNKEILGPQQSTILAGGRYDDLVQSLGSPVSLPAIGWAAGIERLSALRDAISSTPSYDEFKIAIISNRDQQNLSSGILEEIDRHAFSLTCELRKKGYSVSYAFTGSSKKQMKQFGSNSSIFIFVGNDTSNLSKITLRDLKSKQQFEIEKEIIQDTIDTLSQSGICTQDA